MPDKDKIIDDDEIDDINDDIEDSDLNEDNIIIDIDDDVIESPKKSFDYDDDDDYDDFGDYGDEDRFDVLYSLNTNKHKQEGKHALDRDIIFKGRLDDKTEMDSQESTLFTPTKLEKGSLYEYESRYHADYLNQKNISTDIFDVLDQKTSLNYKQNRRKPNKHQFNEYYELLMKDLCNKYTNYEIFVELSYYFTDQIFNMFKLLEKKHAMDIIKELKVRGYLKDLDNLNFV